MVSRKGMIGFIDPIIQSSRQPKRNKRPYLKILLAHYPICITLPEIVIERNCH